MNMLQNFVQRRYAPLMLLLIAGGFVMMLVELIMLDHTDGIQLVAVIATTAGLLLALAALLAPAKWRSGVAVLFVLLSVTGLVGAYEHYEEGAGEEAEAHLVMPSVENNANLNIAYNAQEAAESEDEEAGEEAGEEGEAAPPPLAPLSLAGFGLMGAVATLGKRND